MSITCLEDLVRVGAGRVLVRVAAAALAVGDDPVAALHRSSLRATIGWLGERDATVVLAAAATNDGVAPSFAPAAATVAAAVGRPVRFEAATDVEHLAAALETAAGGEVILLQNLDLATAAAPVLAERLPTMFANYVDDAFAEAWVAHPVLAAVAARFDRQHRALGRHMQNEVDALACLMNRPDEPFVAVLGGPCLVDTVQAMDSLLVKSNRVVVGGGVAAAVLNRSGNPVACPTMTDRCQIAAGDLLAGAAERRVRLVLPTDLVVEMPDGSVRDVDVTAVPAGAVMLDLGPRSRAAAAAAVADAATVFWYGGLGRDDDPRASEGSLAVAAAIGHADGYAVVAGDGTLRALYATPHVAAMSHLSTGGMAALQFIAGLELPGLAAMED